MFVSSAHCQEFLVLISSDQPSSFFPNLLPHLLTALVLASAVSRVGPRNKIGHPARHLNRLMQASMSSARRILTSSKTCGGYRRDQKREVELSFLGELCCLLLQISTADPSDSDPHSCRKSELQIKQAASPWRGHHLLNIVVLTVTITVSSIFAGRSAGTSYS